MKQLVANLRYTLSANFLTLIISIVITLILPRNLGVSDYGFYQLYLFYISYASIFHLGLPDGVYLEIGGEFYEDINKIKLKKQFIVLLSGSVLLSFIFLIIVNLFQHDIKNSIYTVSIISILITNIKVYLLFILQATNKIKEYAKYTRLDRILFFILCIIYITLLSSNFFGVIFIDLFSRFLSLILLIFYMKDIIFLKVNFKLFDTLVESFVYIQSGIKLMLSYVAGLLIIGVIRFAIEANWSIETFSKVSLVLSLSNMMMTFINAISVVLFPILRRIEKSTQRTMFIGLRNLLMPISFGAMLFFYPLQGLIRMWLPSYSDSIYYLGVLFPLFIYEGKVSLLSNTFLKTFREEKKILKINILSLVLSVFLALISVYSNNISIAILSILIVIIFRSNYSELVVSKLIDESTLNLVFIELILTFVFVFCNLFLDFYLALFIYIIFYFIYLCIFRIRIISSLSLLKNMREF